VKTERSISTKQAEATMSASKILNRGPSRMPGRLAAHVKSKSTPTATGRDVVKRGESKMPRALAVELGSNAADSSKLLVQNVYAKSSADASASVFSSALPTMLYCQGNCRSFPRYETKKYKIFFGHPTIQYFSRDQMRAYSLSNKSRLSDPTWSAAVLSHSEKNGGRDGKHTYGSAYAKVTMIKHYSGPATYAMTQYGDLFAADFVSSGKLESLEKEAKEWAEKYFERAYNAAQIACQNSNDLLAEDCNRVNKLVDERMEELKSFATSLRRSNADNWETVADVWIKSSGRTNNIHPASKQDNGADDQSAE
jgi:hypothetical protein